MMQKANALATVSPGSRRRWAQRALAGWALLLPCWLATGTAHGQISREDTAAAQVLFDDAVRLREEGEIGKACPKFAESQRLDPQLGTLLNLADCYEKWGKTASAWISFVEAAGMAKKKKDRRERIARKRAEQLEGKLQKMKLEVAEPVGELKITRNGTEIRSPMWGSEVPVDPGELLIEATAPGHRPWSTTITVNEGDSLTVVEVPALEPDESSGEPNDGSPDDTGHGAAPPAAGAEQGGSNTALLVTGIAAGVVGLGGIGAGVGLGLMSTSKNDESLEHCPTDPNLCDAEGVELRDEARTLETGAIIAYVAGGVLLSTGAVLTIVALASGDDAEETDAAALPTIELLPTVGPGVAYLGLAGAF